MRLRVLVTGHNGYIGSILTGLLTGAGHDVVGCDSFIFEECSFGDDAASVPALRKDIRDLTKDDLEGFDAICHLAGVSNDPIGELSPDVTYQVNHLATVHLAKLAAEVGVERFLFSSSCSIYGSSPGEWVDEASAINPVTAYGWSKIKVEEDLGGLADDDFSPVFLRNATAYGVSPRLRADLVVNNLVGYAVFQGRVYLKSDGTQWRPLIHVEDISRAFLAILEAPRQRVHNQSFNVGSSKENYRIGEVAGIVARVVPDSVVEMAGTAGPDIRDYRVDCSKIAEMVPAFEPHWTVEAGAVELARAFTELDLDESQFFGRMVRLEHIKSLQSEGRLGPDLRVLDGG